MIVRRTRTRRAFSMIEILVVVTVILILAALLIVGVDGLYSQAIRLRCQHRLEQIWHGCLAFENEQGRLPAAYDSKTYVRWYDALLGGKYVSDPRIVCCPTVELEVESSASEGGGSSTVSESELPVLLYNSGTGRCDNDWTRWGTYVSLRAWLHENLEYDVICPQGDDDAYIPLTLPLLSASSQAWILNTEHYEYKRGENVFEPPEISAIRAFHVQGGGIQCWSESYRSDDYYRSTNNVIDACEDVGLRARPVAWSGVIRWAMMDNDHPSMLDQNGYVNEMKSAYSPAYFTIEDGDPAARIIGVATVYDGGVPQEGTWALIAAHDNGTGRVLLHGSYTTLISYGGWPYGDIQRYCLSSEKWLRKSGGLRAQGRCSYGYNNQVGRDGRRPSADTIVVMDYRDWEIDRDDADPAKNDDDSSFAPRHGGRSNALFADGSVRAVDVDDIPDSAWTPEAGQ